MFEEIGDFCCLLLQCSYELHFPWFFLPFSLKIFQLNFICSLILYSHCILTLYLIPLICCWLSLNIFTRRFNMSCQSNLVVVQHLFPFTSVCLSFSRSLSLSPYLSLCFLSFIWTKYCDLYLGDSEFWSYFGNFR